MEKPVQRLAACVLAALVFVLIGAPSAQGSTESLRYVALGDSYSAASGLLPPDPAAPLSCLRSTSNYPHLIAAETGAELTDVTCGGADTGDYFTSQYDGVPPQLDAVQADTQLVTMTIGGNDSGVFIDSIVQCGIAGASTLGQGSPCKDRYGTSFEDTVRNRTYPSLVKALQAVRDAAPDAEVAILGYPWILPTSGGCFDEMPVAEGDVPYLRSLQTTLNDAVRRAADATGATYVDMNSVSEGHDACQPLGVRWIEPVLQGTNPVIVHPNALGEQQMAAQAMTVLGLG
jgi:lysophospholipase L1-like esterase